MTVTLGERGVIDYDQVVTLPIKNLAHSHRHRARRIRRREKLALAQNVS